MDKIQTFWDWFQQNNKPYLFLGQVEQQEQQRLVGELREQLHAYDDKLFFLIGGHPDGDQELIITAEGNVNHFMSVKSLVNNAPQIEGWKVIAFKPPMPASFAIEFQGVKLDPTTIFYQPLVQDGGGDLMGFQFGFSDYDEEKKQTYDHGAFLLLDMLLGEKIFAETVGHVSAGPLPGDFQEQGYEPLKDVTVLVDFFRNQNKQC